MSEGAKREPRVWEPAELRALCRAGAWRGPTAGEAPGYVQVNLVILPQTFAFEFFLFCQRNPKPCPVLEVTEPGDPIPRVLAPSADLRTDLPRYRVYCQGELVDEPTEITSLWRSDLVAFLIGCSFSFDHLLVRAGIPVRHIECGCNVPMYRTSIACRPAGIFAGPLVVSMRPLRPEDLIRAAEITGRYPWLHGRPVYCGDPRRIGIRDLSRPDWGDPVDLHDGEFPVFWACGVTPQAVALEAKLPFMITHSPGCMLVTDLRDEELGQLFG
jgi:uncharacterized protein YcsI (UPF0317 family)